MVNKMTSDLSPKVWRSILIWGLVTYCIQIIATITGEILRGYTDKYTIMSWLVNLSLPVIAFLIGLILSKWKQPKNRIQFASIFTICTFLLCLIGQVLIPYISEMWGHLLLQYIMPAVAAIVLQTLISILLIIRHDKKQIINTRLYIIILIFMVLVSQALQTTQMIPSIINFSTHANIWHTAILPVVLWLLMIIPVILFAILIAVNYLSLKTIKNAQNRLFLACITSTYVFIIISALLITTGIMPLHDTSNLWICIVSYSTALIINGVIVHRFRINNL